MSIDEQMREEELAGATKALTTEAPAEGVHRGAYTYLGIFIRDLCSIRPPRPNPLRSQIEDALSQRAGFQFIEEKLAELRSQVRDRLRTQTRSKLKGLKVGVSMDGFLKLFGRGGRGGQVKG
ncbi:predicted protein [Histoplasma mississippiense (nom. inval.)]|uniref:predicted protein n=1 Tax=Ajellomyces capsulatus (strain NAm1 / WU24) TaxID=2059318 RepID=UPI000157D388|nr:predicted protein [Histoplasma mississippiense (nom. inval.)]EDN04516.1 predicted protein [Histoplasma mississippiense (nom. inval.)]